MESKLKKFLIVVLGILSCSFAIFGCASCSSSQSSSDEIYEYVFDKPFAGTPDDYMTLDGKLDEDIWSDKNYIGNSIDDAEWQATTHFSDKGLYIGLRAVDESMKYVSRYTSRSSFRIYICKTGTQTYSLNSTAYHESRCLIFACDAYYCRSLNRVPYYYKANVEGELNGSEPCTMTAELFLTWKDLYYTEDELGENGYPEDIQMYVSYEGETGEVLGTCLWREECYLHFDKDGYKTLSKYRGDFGNEVYTSTDMWKRNTNGNYYTTAGRTQILWYNKTAEDFLFEVELMPLTTDDNGSDIKFRDDVVNGRFGIISKAAVSDSSINTSDNKSVYTVYSADANSIAKKASGSREIKLRTYKQIDSLHWFTREGLTQETVQSNYSEKSLILRVLKKGDTLYYFYGDTFWKSERIEAMEGETCCGIYTSQGVEILDYTFIDYTDDETALNETLSKYVYFIETPRTDYGSVSTSSETVAKGKSVTITFTAGATGSVLTQVFKNGIDSYDEVVAAMNTSGEYTFTPTEDTTIEAKFATFPKDSLVRVAIEVKHGSSLIKNVNSQVRGNDNKVMYYSLTPNTSGYSIVNVPKAGKYMVDSREFVIDGKYSISTSLSGYLDYNETFILNDDTTSTDVKGNPESVKENKTYTHRISIKKAEWGSVKVNGVNVSGTTTLQYNTETGNYYGVGGVHQYYTAMVGDTFDLKVKLTLSDIAGNNDSLSGIQITNGKYLIVLKTHLNNGRALFIATGTNYSSTNKEIALSNFGWTSAKNFTSSSDLGSGVVDFRVIKSGDAIYIYNGKGSLMCYLNANGVNLVNSSVISWSSGSLSGVNSDIRNFFAAGTEVVVGVRAYGSLKSEYDLNYSNTLSDDAKAKISYASVAVENGTGAAVKTNLKEGYAKGETVKFTVAVDSTIKNAKLQVLLETEKGVQLLEGYYDSEDKHYVFSFVADGTSAKIKTSVITEGDMGWSNDWNTFTPDKENTQI